MTTGRQNMFFRDVTPDYIRTALLVHGADMPRRKSDEPLRYLQLGHGSGLSLNVHCAAVGGEFWGTDANPDHSLHASEMAQAAGLDTHLLNLDYAELDAMSAASKLPLFDFMVLDGVWSWVSDENRGHILNLVKRNLKMGGAVFVSYNALPMWAPFMPVRDLMSMGADMAGGAGGASGAGLQSAYALARHMQQAGAGYFVDNPPTAVQLESLEGMPHAAVPPEFFSRHWRPFYFSDVAAAFSRAKCSFVTSTRLLAQLDVCLPPDVQTMLREVSDMTLKETLRDYALNQPYRADIFVKGSRPLTRREHMGHMGTLAVVLTCPLEGVDISVAGPRGALRLKEEIYKPVLAALADINYAPKTLEQLEDHPLLSAMDSAVLVEALVVLCGAGYAHPARNAQAAQREACQRLNSVLCQRARLGEDSTVLASPVLGGAVATSRVECLFLLSRAEGGESPSVWAQDALNVLSARGEGLARQGVSLEPEEALREMVGVAEDFDKVRLPYLAAVGAVPHASSSERTMEMK